MSRPLFAAFILALLASTESCGKGNCEATPFEGSFEVVDSNLVMWSSADLSFVEDEMHITYIHGGLHFEVVYLRGEIEEE